MSSSWLPPRSFRSTWLNQNNSENEPFLNRNSHGTGKVVTLDCTAWWLFVVVDMVGVVLLSCLSNDSGGSWGSNGVSVGSNSWGSGVSSGKGWGGGVSNTGDSWGSSDGSNWGVRDSVDWGSVSSD